MGIESEIIKSQRILNELFEQVQRLHELGVDPSDRVFDIYAARLEKELAKWECLAYENWEYRYWIHDTLTINKN